MYQPLVTLNGSSMYGGQGVLQVLPDLASNWTITQNGTIYTFNLRQGVTFSNGDPFNAYQVWGEMYAFYYLSFNSSGWFIGYNFFNMSDVSFGPSTIALMNQSGLVNPNSQLLSIMQNNSWPIYVTGPNQIVFKLQVPESYFLEALGMWTGMIFDTQWALEHGGFGTPVSLNTYFNQHPIPGTGPYMVTSVVEENYVEFTQNPTYWGKNLTATEIASNPYLSPGSAKNVIVQAKTDDVTRYLDLSSGKAQIASIQSEDWPLIASSPSTYSYLTLPSNSMLFVGLAMNTLRYPTNITAVRQAIAHAINYSDINSTVYFGSLAPMVGPEYSAQTQFYDLGNFPPYQYNVTLAQQILSKANLNASNFPALEFPVLSGCGPCITVAQIVQGDLASIGLTVSVQVVPHTTYNLPLVDSCSYACSYNASQTIAQLQWIGGLTWAPFAPTPVDSWNTFVSNQSPSDNYANYYNPVVQACVNAFSNGTTASTLTSLCTKAQAQVYNDAPYAWFGFCKLFLGAGSIAWKSSVVKSALGDPDYSGLSATVVFNTVQLAS